MPGLAGTATAWFMLTELWPESSQLNGTKKLDQDKHLALSLEFSVFKSSRSCARAMYVWVSALRWVPEVGHPWPYFCAPPIPTDDSRGWERRLPQEISLLHLYFGT